MKKTAVFILYNLTAVVAILVVFELLVGIFIPQIAPQGTDHALYEENRFGAAHGLKPGGRGLSNGVPVEADEHGFRRTSVKIDTSKDGWLFLGDSVTMGIGVEADSTFAGRIQARMNGINILNPSMIGYNVNDYLAVFNHFIIKETNAFKIKKVFVFWCLNDIYIDSDVIQMPGGKTRSVFGGALNEIRGRTKTYFFLKTLLLDRPKSYFEFDSRLYGDAAKVEACVEKIALLNSECLERGIAFRVVFLPYEYQLRKNTTEVRGPQLVMERRLGDLKIETMDVMPCLSVSGADSKQLYLYGDGIHFSSKGHWVIADCIMRRR